MANDILLSAIPFFAAEPEPAFDRAKYTFTSSSVGAENIQRAHRDKSFLGSPGTYTSVQIFIGWRFNVRRPAQPTSYYLGYRSNPTYTETHGDFSITNRGTTFAVTNFQIRDNAAFNIPNSRQTEFLNFYNAIQTGDTPTVSVVLRS